MTPTLIAAGERLADLLDLETATLRSPHPGDIARLQEEKGRLARLWAEGVERLKQAADAGPGEAGRQALARAATRLDEAARRNETVLKAVTIATDRVVVAIADAVRG
jgi:hypothetical protein